MKGWIETTRVKSGSKVAIRTYDIANVTECVGDTACIVMKHGDAYHVSLTYEQAVTLMGFRGDVDGDH